MSRLAEYMSQVATLLGNQEYVHFEKLEEGSAVLVSTIDEVAIPKVEQRIASLRHENAPEDAQKAVDKINEMLRDDNTRGELAKGPAKILPFPGRDIPRPVKIGPINQNGSLDGVLVRIGGKDETAHALLIDAESRQWTCIVTRDMARQMAHHLFGAPMRLFGNGKWERNEAGNWNLLKFTVDTFKILEDRNLEDAIHRLRSIQGSEWDNEADPIALLNKMRSGPDEIH